MKRVLVTGASGFIGYHCLQPLATRGYEVHALSSKPRAETTGVVWHQADLLEPGSARALLADIRPTHLLHLAWFVVPGKLISAPENFAWVTGSLDLVQQFAAVGGQRLVSCGSGYEYDWRYGYCSEKLTPNVPNSVYGACKVSLYLMTEALAGQTGLSAAWGRVFFLYGPREHPDRLISSVIRALLGGQPARCSHGRQIRDYMHVQDVADGLVALLDSSVAGAVNVCSGQAATLREMVLSVGRMVGRPELVHLGAVPARANDAPLVVGDNTRIASEVGWKQRLDLETGLNHTIEWWKATLCQTIL
ncbi:MAG: NAD-dependent epimerase/dehydratase family protein [Bryobacteraceae bacterium]